MADYQVVDREQLDADMTDVADHIRAKAEISTPLAWPDGYKAAVDAIQTGVELPELTNPGAASDLLAGKELIGADGEVVVGTVPERDSDDLIVSNNGIVVPAGHYTKQASAALDSVELATPSIEVSDNGLITARVVQPSSYVSFSAKSQTKQLPTQGATTITPTDTPQKAVEAGTYVTGDIMVDAAEGGVDPPDSLALDPDVVYATTRPKDWLTMPTPGDGEIYLLCHIPDGLDGVFTATILTPGTTAIEIGNLVDGEFVPKQTITPTHNVRLFVTVEASDYADVTADGYKQYIVRIKGNFKQALLYPETSEAYAYGVPMIVEAIIGAEADVRFGFSAEGLENCKFLRYVRFVGNGALTNLSGFNFRACGQLLSISAEKTSEIRSADYLFSGCTSLMAISDKLLVDGATYNYAFGRCILRLPQKNFKPKTAVAIFRSTEMRDIDFGLIDTSECDDLTYVVNNASAKVVRNLNISSATGFLNPFGATQLVALTFAGDTTPGGWTIAITHSLLSHQALVEMINSLPTATAAATITITGNPGASELTDEEIAIATAKNWTITI